MIIISHRGYWKAQSEKNQAVAFRRSFESGFGTETDIRDSNGHLVISHDMPIGGEMRFDAFLEILGRSRLPIALNIKADGLAVSLAGMLRQREIDHFVFDMSIPDMRTYLSAGFPVFARMSEVELHPAWLDQVSGIWLDAFLGSWYSQKYVAELLLLGKRVCVVSPELHGREFLSVWELLKPISAHTALMLCTDMPEEARDFFGISQ